MTVNGLTWWTDLRPGADGCTDVFDRALETAVYGARKHPRREVICRVDGYYVSKGNIRIGEYYAEQHRNLIYLVSAHDPDMKEGRWEELVAGSGQPWKRVNSTTEIKELGSVRPWGDETDPVRAIAVRRRGSAVKKGKRASPVEKRYLILTNAARRRLGTRSLFKAYHRRQQVEFSFKDGKQSLSTAKMPTLSLSANRAHVKLVALAQLIMKLFAKRFLPHKGVYGPTCKTIREKVVAIGGKNHRGTHRPIVLLPPIYYAYRWLRHLCREVRAALGVVVVMQRGAPGARRL